MTNNRRIPAANRSATTLTLVLVAMFPASALSQSGWEWQNPLPQGNILNDIEAVTPLIGYAAGDHGSVVRTTSGGLSWDLLAFPLTIDISDLEFIDEHNGFACGTDFDSVYLFVTYNSGIDWAELHASAGNRIAFDLLSDGTGWLSADSTLRFTSDRGITWESRAVLEPMSDIIFIDGLTGWAIGNKNIYRSTDGGVSWQVTTLDLRAGPFTGQKLVFESPLVGWVSGNSAQPNSLEGYLMRTSDGGVSWEERLVVDSYLYEYITDIEFPSELSGWVITSRGSVHRTDDGGETWEEISDEAFLKQITVSSDGTLWGTGEVGDQIRSTDGGLTWISTAEGVRISYASSGDIFVLNRDEVFVVQRESLLKTTNGGQDWRLIEIGDFGNEIFYPQTIWFTNRLNGWIGCDLGGGWGGLYRTTDGGESWQPQDENLHDLSDIFFLNDTLGWFAGHDIHRTTNRGESWELLLDVSTEVLSSVFFTSKDSGWAGGYIGVYQTTDGGVTWDVVRPFGEDFNTYDIQFLTSSLGWVIGSLGGDGTILKTTDGGSAWENQIDSTYPYFYFESLFMADEENGWVICNDFWNSLLHTSNGGNTWEEVPFPSHHSLFHVAFADAQTGWVIGEHGTIFHTESGGLPTPGDPIPQRLSLRQNYPNPFNGVTTIEFDVATAGEVVLRVYDILGREVAIIARETIPPGIYTRQWDADGLPSGVYFYRLQAGGFVETRKLVLLR